MEILRAGELYGGEEETEDTEPTSVSCGSL